MQGAITVGLDIGTQGVRGVAFNSDIPLASAEMSLSTQSPQSGYAEQSPDAVWSATMAVLKQITQELRGSHVVFEAVGLDATASVFLVDAMGTPLTPMLLWMDTRAGEEAKELGHRLGHLESAELPWAKALWMKRHWPTIFDESTYLMEIGDWLIWRLTGVVQRNWASSILKWHAQLDGSWPGWVRYYPELLEKLPPIGTQSGDRIGHIMPHVAAMLGISSPIAVASPLIDAYAGALGLGAVNVGDLALIFGTSTCELWHGQNLLPTAGLWGPFPDIYGLGVDVIEAGHPSTGSVVRWIQHYLGHDSPLEQLDAEAGKVPSGSNGLLVSPAFQGVRSPWPEASARGEIRGLTLAHAPQHILRAAYEGMAYNVRQVMEVLPGTPHRLVATGGGTRSALWMQMIVDVVGKPITIGDDYATNRGASWLARRCIGLTRGPITPTTWHIVEPSNNFVAYNELYREYCRVFPTSFSHTPGPPA